MKRAVSCMAALAALSSTGVYAKTATLRCTAHRQVIRSGDNAMELALRSGVDANSFATWLKKADPATRQALKHMRPGDVFDACLVASGTLDHSVASLHITRDKAGRKLAQQADQPKLSSPSLFAGVVGEAITAAHVVSKRPPVLPAAVPAATNPLIRQLTPGHLLSEELTRLLGHHPVVATTIAYARKKWHLPERLPMGSRCTLALLPAGESDSRMRLVYVQFDYRGRKNRVYHYVDSLGHDFMVGAHGQGYRVLNPLLPVTDARISSGWGWRIQPVLGGNEFHQGIDYAAPAGTPIRATMDGVIDIAEWRGEYGRLVEIKHAGGVATRYAHLSSFAAHLPIGSHVHRGQVIGYVGSSGLSTGPHLYYEVWDHGNRINPLIHQQMMVTANLDPLERRRFVAYVSSILAAP